MSTPPEKVPQTANPKTKTKARGKRRYLFRLLAILIGLTPFILLELILVAMDVGRPARYDDPFVGFSGIHPLFVKSPENGDYITSPSRQFYFGKQQFPAQKPKNGYRIFCLGGSTVRGRPHETDTAFAQWLQIELNGQDPSRSYQTVNCGGLSYASYRLRPILNEVMGYSPDLIVLATGHNEFLEDRTYHDLKSRSKAQSWLTDRLYSLRTVTIVRQWFSSPPGSRRPVLPDEVTARLDDKSGYASYHRNDQWWEDVIAHYRLSLETMVQNCQQKKLPVILVNLGSNLRDCPPFKSEHKPGLSEQDQKAFDVAFDFATQEEQQAFADPELADVILPRVLSFYRQAEAIDDQYSLLHFRMARCLERMGKLDEAEKHYIKAKEWDICPLRMKERLHAILKEVAEKFKVPLVDIKTLLKKQSRQGIPGFDLYVDHVHPTIAAHQKIAQALYAEMSNQKLVTDQAKPWSENDRRKAYRDHIKQMSPTILAASKKRIGWLENWARRWKLTEEVKPVDAQGTLRLGYRELEIGREEEATTAFLIALVARPDLKERLLAYAHSFIQQGRPKAARVVLDALSHSPDAEINRKRYLLVAAAIEVENGNKQEALNYYQSYQKAPDPKEPLPKEWQAITDEALSQCKIWQKEAIP